MSQQPHPAYTPASFAIPAMNTAPQSHGQSQVQGQQQQQQQQQPPRRRGRPPRQSAPAAPDTHPGMTTATPRPTINNPPVHPAYKPSPPQPQQNLIQVDAESFTRLVQQVQSHQAIINSLQARIDILEQARFSSHFHNHNTSNNQNQNHNPHQQLQHDSGDSDSDADSDSNSPIHRLLLPEINQSYSNSNSNPSPSNQHAPQGQPYLTPTLPSPSAGWSQPNFTNPVPPPNQAPDMAYPPEGQKFAFLLTIDPQTGRKWIGGGSQGASAVLNAWTGPHGYRIRTRRSKIKAGRYYLTICCAWSADKQRARKPSPTEEELEEARAEGRRKPYQRRALTEGQGDLAAAHDCPFRFVMKQVEKDGALFEVRWMRNSGVSAPHNHGPDPMALVPTRVRTRF